MFIQEAPTLANQFDEDRVLQSVLARLLPEDVRETITPELRDMGELAAGELWNLSQEYRSHLPTHTPFDPWGNRIDEVEVSPAWKRFAEIATEKGLVSTAYERKSGPYSRLHQFSLVYLFDRSSQVYTCPLAMTDGCARSLETIAEPDLRDRVLPHLISRDPKESWTSGQWMTERTGGSDVGLSETVARKTNDGWRLYGNKWFTSAVTSEVALTLARPEGNSQGGKGLALFFVELRDRDGRLNGIVVNRLKDKLGTKLLPTAEIDLEGTLAQPVSGLTDGVRNMANMLNITRTWNAVCSVSGMRRGLALARDYAKRRVAFGAALSEKPLHLDTLANLSAEYEAAMQLVFRSVHLMGRAETEEISTAETSLLRVLQPVAKLLTGKQAVACTSEILECFGGAGYMEDTGLPELHRDAQVLSIWEGTTNVLALETFRAIKRAEAIAPLGEEITRALATGQSTELREPAEAARKAFEHAVGWWQEAGEDLQRLEAGARRFAMTLGRSLSLALLVEHAQWTRDHQEDMRATYAAQRYAKLGVDLITQEHALGPKQLTTLAMG